VFSALHTFFFTHKKTYSFLEVFEKTNMSGRKNEEFVIQNHADGHDDLKNIWKLKEAEYPKIKGEGEFIYETLYLSVDPYLSSSIKVKSTLGGKASDVGSVQKSLVTAKVVESKNAEYPVGTVFITVLPWSRYGVANGKFENYVKIVKKPGQPENYFDRLGYSSTIGSLGMPSQTAYYGATQVGKFNSSDVLVVSGAAGAVGSIVGQIAKKILGVKKVIGVAGGKEKCDLIIKEFGFDAAIDYKEYNTQEKVVSRLNELTAESGPITAYFDNTGGFVTDAVFEVIARKGRIIVCGQISQYHNSGYVVPNYLAKTVYKALSILGFLVFDFYDQNEKEFFAKFPEWVEKGTIKTKETLVKGFEKLPEAYEMLFTGKNTGKIVVQA
jgi:NADPH-dependent curcumin reductase CurA